MSERPNPDAREWAALFALEALVPEERRAIAERYANDEAFWSEVESLRRLAGDVAASAAEVRPERSLWERIETRLHGERLNPATVSAESSEADFVPFGVPGVEVRILSSESDCVTLLARMAQGASFPAHRHTGREEAFLIEGDLYIGEELQMAPGDYRCMEAGTVHAEQHTRAGCLVLLRVAPDDLPAGLTG